MNPHSLELRIPRTAFPLSLSYEHMLDHGVFASEPRLYSGNQNINNRLHKDYLVVCESLYSCNDVSDEVLETMKAAAISWHTNVTSYWEASCGTPQRKSSLS